MDPNELALRTLLIDINETLSHDDIAMLGFLVANDVPRRVIDTVTRDSHASMSPIWDILIETEKITPGNVGYLITRFEKIRRMDIVYQLHQYSANTAF